MTQFVRTSKSNPNESYDSLYARKQNLKADLEELEEALKDVRKDLSISVDREESKELGERVSELTIEIEQYSKALREVENEISTFAILPHKKVTEKMLSDDFNVSGSEIRKPCKRCKRTLPLSDYLSPSDDRCLTCGI